LYENRDRNDSDTSVSKWRTPNQLNPPNQVTPTNYPQPLLRTQPLCTTFFPNQ
jgi:hypothetical protein